MNNNNHVMVKGSEINYSFVIIQYLELHRKNTTMNTTMGIHFISKRVVCP